MDTPAWGSGAPKAWAKKKPHEHAPVIRHVRHRRGLAVIADFTDTRLEDWSGEGLRSVPQLVSQLRPMEAHWEWLSRGLEDFEWDVIRMTLPVSLGPQAYPDLSAYREAVATAIRQKINTWKYDANRDGVIDTVWVIASNRGSFYPYMSGGTSRHGNVNMFVDIQNSQSLVVGATGNFNHELAHTIGIPDLYGPFDTLHYLTVMSDSWALPPQGFTAYEQQRLSWIRPRRIDSGSRLVHLRLSKEHQPADAVRIDSLDPNEYFLIEYRRRPESGFGSHAPPYSGLVVYHVLEGSNQWSNPPLLKIEAADGQIAAGSSPQLSDFLFIDNPSMNRPLILRSYFGGAEVFKIDNLFWAGPEGIGFNVVVAPRASAINLLANSSFELGNNNHVASWDPEAWVSTSIFARDPYVTHEGQASVSIQSLTENDARWIQHVTGLTPGRSYQ